MSSIKPNGVLSLVEKQLDALRTGDIPAWLETWHDEGVIEFPFAPPGYNKRVEGKAAISEYMSGFPSKIKLDRLEVVSQLESVDGNQGFFEFTCKGTVVSTGKPYDQHYVCMLQLKDGKVVLYRDFWNPLVAIEAFGGADAFINALHARAS